jgi:hypothetical protein
MLRSLITSLILVLIVFSVNVKAQSTDEISELKPYSEWLEKKRIESERNNPRPVEYMISFGPPQKLKTKFNLVILSTQSEENITSIAFTTPIKEIVFEDIERIPTSRIRYFGRITSNDKKFDRVFEFFSILTRNLDELKKINSQATIFKKSFRLQKGKYRFEFIITDVKSGNYRVKSFKMEIK